MSDFQPASNAGTGALPSKRPPNDIGFKNARQLYEADGGEDSFASLIAGFKSPAVEVDGMDSLAAHLADDFGISLQLSEKIEAWFSERECASVNLRAGSVVRAVLERICTSPNPAITAEAIRAAFGFARGNDDTMRASARRIGCTVAAISKRSLKIRHALGLNVQAFSKTKAAMDTYKKSNGRNPDGSFKRSQNEPGAPDVPWVYSPAEREADLPAIGSGPQSALHLASRDSGPPRAQDGQCEGTAGQA